MKINLNFNNGSADGQDGCGKQCMCGSPLISMDFLGRIGIDGKSAYEIAVGNGFTGSEREWLESLMQQAQIPALFGKQTGAVTSSGYYMSADPALLSTGEKTVELLFTTPADISSAMQVLSTGTDTNLGVAMYNGELRVNAGALQQLTQTLSASSTYHLVMSFGADESTIYLNGWPIGQGAALSGQGIRLTLGAAMDGSRPFAGTIHRLRFFNFTFDKNEVAWLWNAGIPTDTMLHDEMKSGARSCIAEYLACGLLESVWRDTTPGETELTAVGRPYFSYVPPQNLREIVIKTGKFVGMFSTAAYAREMHIPRGYVPMGFEARNYNVNEIVNFRIISATNVTQVVTPLTIPVHGVEERFWFPAQCFRYHDDDYLKIIGSGNNKEGFEVTGYFCWRRPF